LLIFFWSSRRFPVPSMFAGCFAGGAMLFAVVFGTGGASSEYYVGLVLLFIGTGVLMPMSARQGAAAIGTLFCVYVWLPALLGNEAPWQNSALSLFFLGAAAFEGVMCCAILDRIRFVEFKQRVELEQARDQLKELDREKSRFTANVHHELRTPLTLTLAPLEAMLEGSFGEVSELQRSYLTTMRSNSRRLLKLINNLLDLAKIEGNQLKVKRRPTQLGELVEELVSGARPMAERKGIELEALGLAELPQVNLDPDAFEKVLVNLLGNSLKFTNRGGRIEVRAERSDDGGIHLIVADSGVGLPESQLERIFDRFAQVDGSNTRRHEGTGIGLALVKELVELHGGRIWAESDGLGTGTRMHVKLPEGEADVSVEEALLGDGAEVRNAEDALGAIEAELGSDPAHREGMQFGEMQRTADRAEGHERGPSGLVASSTAANHPAGTPEVLLVDDNEDMRRLLAFLVGQEFNVRVACDGREALERVRESKPSLIVTDVMMPVMSGTELCRAIKGDAELDDIPVMLVTSKAEREMKIEGLELGADDYVTKPFHPRELMARVRALVRVKVLRAELSERNDLLESTNRELQTALEELRETGSQLVQAERLAAVGELAAGIAHEVNNPVNFASNALRTLRSEVEQVESVVAQLAEMDWQDETRLKGQLAQLHKLRSELGFDEVAGSLSELASIVAEGLERTTRLVGDLRDFAAPGDGPRADIDLHRGLESTLHLMNHRLRDASIQLVLDFADELPPIAGDAGALNQVFLNLLKNATEALDGRAGTVTLSTRLEEASILVEIRDDGPGIAPEHLAQVFEPFYSTKSAGRGTGLGLSMSRRIVMEHGGSIEVVSLPGEGTAFSVRLPIRGRHGED
jgi:signal transduction histidine kinase